jgi:hypothetical protein
LYHQPNDGILPFRRSVDAGCHILAHIATRPGDAVRIQKGFSDIAYQQYPLSLNLSLTGIFHLSLPLGLWRTTDAPRRARIHPTRTISI